MRRRCHQPQRSEKPICSRDQNRATGRLNWRKRAVPWVTYTAPEVAHAGPPCKALRDGKDKLSCPTMPANENDRG